MRKISRFYPLLLILTLSLTGCSGLIESIFGLPHFAQPEQLDYVIDRQLREVDLDSLSQKSKLLHDASMDQIHQYLKEKKVSCVEITAYYLHRIKQLNPSMRAVISVNPAAIDEAKQCDEQTINLQKKPLWGIPILVKDNIESKDAMPTTAGTIALKEYYPDEDADVVAKLRSSGAIILAKANLSELAGLSFIAPAEPAGYSPVGGQTMNPYGPGKWNVSGSSSGSAAGVALDFAPVAIGTETYGSIIGTASANSVVGVKPTLGLLSKSGIIPLSHTYDTAGPLTKTVKDAALLLSVMAGYRPNDSRTYDKNYFSELNKTNLKGIKIAASSDFVRLAPGRQILAKFKQAGAKVDIMDYQIPADHLKEIFKEIVAHEFHQDMNEYLQKNHPVWGLRSLSDLIDYNQENPDKRIPYGQSHLLRAQRTKLTPKEHQQKIAYLRKITEKQVVIPFFEQKKYDVILTINSKASRSHFGTLPNDISAYASLPSICLPAGYIHDNQPISITLVGPKHSEKKLLQIAHVFEQIGPKRKPPQIKS